MALRPDGPDRGPDRGEGADPSCGVRQPAAVAPYSGENLISIPMDVQ
jgi:hypothetical protein